MRADETEPAEQMQVVRQQGAQLLFHGQAILQQHHPGPGRDSRVMTGANCALLVVLAPTSNQSQAGISAGSPQA